MASELQVTTIRGVPTGANANQINIPSGQTLAAPGHIIQVVQATKNTVTDTTSTTFVDSGLTATITPTSSSSKILVIADFACAATNNSAGMVIQLLRGSTQLFYKGDAYSTAGGHYGTDSFHHLDSPATTSATTYNIQFLSQSASTTCQFNPTYGGYPNPTCHITLMEIAQ